MIAEGVYYPQRKLARKEATMAAMTQDVRELFETAENMVLCTASCRRGTQRSRHRHEDRH